MNFSWFFSKKIAWSTNSGNELSSAIVRIGQAAVAIGIIVALITLSTGIGARKEIKHKLADFNGHITIQPYSSNLSYNSDSIKLPLGFYPSFPLEEIEHIQAIATKSGIIRTESSFDGVLLKGVDERFDKERFKKFLRKGQLPTFNTNELNESALISQKIADNFYLSVDSTFLMVFVDEKNPSNKPMYRKFKVAGIYATDIEQFDDLFVIADIRHVQKLNGWDNKTVGGFELFSTDVEDDLIALKERVNEEVGYNLIARSATQEFADIEEWVNIFDMNIFIILTIMLIVVIINMVMILLILILERTHSIGVLKTLGAVDSQIQLTFIFYSLFIMIPGLVIGNVIALGFLFLQKQFGFIQLSPENYFISTAPVYLTWEMVLLVNLGSLLICALVLLVPSILIKRVSPVKALKMK